MKIITLKFHWQKKEKKETFYASPSPTAAPFVKEGDSVKEGQTLCIVEAMKLMNEVKSTVSGKIKKVLVKDKDSIKKGQALFIVE